MVYVMSGRQPEELDRLFKRAPGLGLIAENGCFLKDFGSSEWTELADPGKMRAWKDSVEGIMKYYHERTPGSWIETRHCSLIFHYKNAEDFESASRQAGDCASHINDACEEQRVRAIPLEGKSKNACTPNLNANDYLGAVAVEPIDWSKGTAAMKIFEGLEKKFGQDDTHKSPVDFLMVVGDGRDDEVIFRWANEISRSKKVQNVTTVSLGSRNTEAGYTLTQGVTGMYIPVAPLAVMTNIYAGVLTALQKLAQLS
jgi:trehalose-phosphatase